MLSHPKVGRPIKKICSELAVSQVADLPVLHMILSPACPAVMNELVYYKVFGHMVSIKSGRISQMILPRTILG